MLGKFKSDWLGLGVIVLAVTLFFGGMVNTSSATDPTITTIVYTQTGGGQSGHLQVVYSDGSSEDYYYNQSDTDHPWTWYTHAPTCAGQVNCEGYWYNGVYTFYSGWDGTTYNGECGCGGGCIPPLGPVSGYLDTPGSCGSMGSASGYGSPDPSLATDTHWGYDPDGKAKVFLWQVLNPNVALPQDGGAAQWTMYFAAADADICSTEWQAGWVGPILQVGSILQGSFQEYKCVGNVKTLVRSGDCSYLTVGGSCSCRVGGLVTGAWPAGWDCLDVPGSFGTCLVDGCPSGPPPGCTGSVTWTSTSAPESGILVWSQTGSTCSAGCNPVCPAAPTAAGQTATTSCSSAATGTCATGLLPCTGAPSWAASVADDGKITWVLQTQSACGNGCVPVCPSAAPESGSSTASTSCSRNATGTCPSKTPTCTGTCNYSAVLIDSADASKGYKWGRGTNNCSTASNCGCPDNPGGACPTGASDTKTVSCGTANGSACSPTGGGGCDSSCVFKWNASNTTGCPSDTLCAWKAVKSSAGVYSWVNDGTSGTACDKCDCTVKPTDDAKAHYLADPDASALQPCDGASAGGSGRWSKESGDCGSTCECVAPTTDGKTDGEIQTVSCKAKAQTCECKFSWDTAKTELLYLLQQRFGWLVLGDGAPEPLCWSVNIGGGTVLGYTLPLVYQGRICTAYPNPVSPAESVFEVVRTGLKVVCRAVIWWQFMSWVVNTFVSGW